MKPDESPEAFANETVENAAEQDVKRDGGQAVETAENVIKEPLRHAVEAILFASERALSAADLKEAFGADVSEAEIREALEQLRQDYGTTERGFALAQIAGGFQLVSDPRYCEILKRFFLNREKRKLSPASLETLSIIAYKQPVTKVDIEFVRGVNVDGPLKTLLDKGLVKIAGRKEMPGRPILYGTTKEFLDRFGLASIKELPPLSQFTERDIDPDLLPPEMKRQDTSQTDSADAAAVESQPQTDQPQPISESKEDADESQPNS